MKIIYYNLGKIIYYNNYNLGKSIILLISAFIIGFCLLIKLYGGNLGLNFLLIIVSFGDNIFLVLALFDINKLLIFFIRK